MRLTKERSNVTTEYLYDGQQPLIELRSDDVRTDYVLGFTGMPLARTVTDGENSATDYYLHDGLGCVMALGNAGFSITQTLEYDVWGSQRAGQGSSTNALKYVGSLGHPSDDDTGLVYMRARYYDPDVARFLSEDPGRQGVNWFGYAGNRPADAYDLDGREWTVGNISVVTGIISGLFAGLMSWADQALSGGEMSWARVGVAGGLGFLGGLIGGGFGAVVGKAPLGPTLEWAVELWGILAEEVGIGFRGVGMDVWPESLPW